MKRLAPALLIAFGAFYLHAGEQTATTADSPLVAAAKSAQKTSSKNAKKKIVITNETLAKSGGHVTTSSAPSATQPLPKANPLPKVADNLAETAKAKQAAEAKKRKDAAAEHANAIYEGDDPEGIYEDPARTEGRMQKNSPPAPQQPTTVQTQQPPTVQVGKPPV